MDFRQPDKLDVFPQIVEFKAYLRRPRLLLTGNVVELFIEKDSPFADAALVLAQGKYHDCEVAVKIWITKHPDGRSAAGETLE